MGDKFQFLNGYFVWNSLVNELQFISQVSSEDIRTTQTKQITEVNVPIEKYKITFKEDIDLMDKISFKKKYRRKIDPLIDKVILLQDVKDVVLFTANPMKLSYDFVKLIHTPKCDRLFRALIIYFQYYFQTWEFLKVRRNEKESKISKEGFTPSEITIRDDLADLRCMVAREYFSIIICADNKARFYERSNNLDSLAESDRRIVEMFIHISIRVVWHALNKPPISMIEAEINRLVRSNSFNTYEHNPNSVDIYLSDDEKHILRGVTDITERRMFSQTPLGKEFLLGPHDHRMLAIGQNHFPPDDERLRFLEKAYLLPEEELTKNNVSIGILGLPLVNFNVMLKPKRKTKRDEEAQDEPVFDDFNLPPPVKFDAYAVPWKYPSLPCRIKVNDRNQILKTQCGVWLRRVSNAAAISQRDFTIENCKSMFN